MLKMVLVKKRGSPLSVIIDKANDRFGIEFTELNKVLVQIKLNFDKYKK